MSKRGLMLATLLIAVFVVWATTASSADTQAPTVVVTLTDGRALSGQIPPFRFSFSFRTSLDTVGVRAEKTLGSEGGDPAPKPAVTVKAISPLGGSASSQPYMTKSIWTDISPERSTKAGYAVRDISFSRVSTGPSPSTPGSTTAGMIWSLQVREGLSADRVVESLKSLATTRNILFVGESPVHKQIQAITGEPYRYVNILSFTADVRTVKLLLDYAGSDDYLLYVPYWIAIMEDRVGRLWLHGPNPERMNYGDAAVPPSLREAVSRFQESIKAIMEGAAAGEY